MGHQIPKYDQGMGNHRLEWKRDQFIYNVEWDTTVGWKRDEFINNAKLFSGRDFIVHNGGPVQ
jgi:hypothetical protein